MTRPASHEVPFRSAPTLKLISWNINGIRAGERKGFLEWFTEQNADVVCLQEIKAHPDQLSEKLLHPDGYQSLWHPAKRPGYSGLGVYCKTPPAQIIEGIGDPEFDEEGRVFSMRFQDFWLINTYCPHSRRDLSRLDFKMAFNEKYSQFCDRLRRESELPLIVCGDLNTAHNELDLTNDRANRRNAGFLPEERAWLDEFLDSGFVDCFRHYHPLQKGHYTWWSNRKGVRERNVGWRIDYHLVDRRMMDRVLSVSHQSDVLGSDHCPIVLELA